jgi:hypothetical protein
MYKELLRSIAGIEVFPVISLTLFVIVFTLMLIRVWRLDAHRLKAMAALPLDRHPASDREIATRDKGVRL